MSCYIVDEETIHAIVKGFMEYQVDFPGTDSFSKPYIIFVEDERKRIGQALLAQNYKSYCARYGEEKIIPKYEPADVEIDEGIVYGCITCYEYQASETPGYYESSIHEALDVLKSRIEIRLFKKLGMKVPYGYNGHNILED